MPTPTPPYAQPADLISRIDVRRLGQLVNDDGTQASAGSLLTNANLAAALIDAAGMIDAEVLRGGRYLQSDLIALIANPLLPSPPPGATQAAAFLIRLNCDLAYGLLVERRGFTQSEAQAQAPGFARAMAVLQRLGLGDLVFNVPGAIAAGKPANVALDARLQLISGTRRLFGDLTVNPFNPISPPVTD